MLLMRICQLVNPAHSETARAEQELRCSSAVEAVEVVGAVQNVQAGSVLEAAEVGGALEAVRGC